MDAALDLSHTQNIGHMLKTHFMHSQVRCLPGYAFEALSKHYVTFALQFIVVSLKDGMFNNANVLFRTKFVDGMSTVSRTAQKLSKK